jgi:Ca-activated chloride channel family protein
MSHRTTLSLAVAAALALSACSHTTSSPQPVTATDVKTEADPTPRERAQAQTPIADAAKRQEADNEVAPVRAAQPGPALAPPAPPASVATGAVAGMTAPMPVPPGEPASREHYERGDDNPVHRVADEPVSTFSIDVDTGSYTNVRRMLNQGALPPADAVRAEEFINYFDYGYAAPANATTPFRVTTEAAPAPWNADRTLLLVGLKGYEIPRERIPASNLVFLIDTSGSMADADKLPLLIEAFKQMVPDLRAADRVSIVVYAGSAGLVLPPTAGDRHEEIIAALDRLSAGGSTNGGEGITLAYAMARDAYIDGGVNRVILATDGDFNVGTTDPDALETLVADQRKSGIALTTLGFGTGNYNDAMAERLADVGNGNHAYIDTVNEARKVLVDEAAATMLTIAADVKIQLEFNPAVVAEYRLIGYENRMLRREDFNNDAVDAGEIGAGHDVTALYELTLVGAPTAVDPLRYAPPTTAGVAASTDEIGFLKLRWKAPGAQTSTLATTPIRRADIARVPSPRLALAAAVAGFADHLRGGEHMAGFGLDRVAALAEEADVPDPFGYRAELLALIQRAAAIKAPDGAERLTIAD